MKLDRILALFVLITGFLATSTMTSQEMVVSEYFNIQDVNNEWTELVVVQDNLNAVGWMLIDANTSQITRQGGPKFNDIPLWRNLRAGTIIVLWHRALPATVPIDTNAADGYLELSARDIRFFQTVYFASPSDLADLNIADAGDVLEILRADSSHVHGLGHNKPPGPAYTAMPMPKANYDFGTVGAGRSNRVTGRTLAAYGADITVDSVVGSLNDSRGLPNRFELSRTNAGVPNINHWFWRSTREPIWSATPAITLVTRAADRHVIEWTPVIDANPGDQTTGYVILRDTLHFASFPANGIRDGQMITPGTRIGSAVVLDVRPTSRGTRYTDSVNLACGQSYSYRVYGYRYRQDDHLAVTDNTTGRGRQYTATRFPQSAVITKPNPTQPVIQASRLQFCFGDTVSLTTTAVADRYDWTLNGTPLAVGGTTRVVVNEPGTYRLTVTADGGCVATSDPVTITTLPAPEVDIAPKGLQTICIGDTLVLTAMTDAPSYEWLRNGSIITGATGKTYVVRSDGDYQVRIASSQGCPGISSIVRVRIPDVRYSFAPSGLDFGTLGQCTSDTTLEIELINNGAVDITITSTQFPPGFALASPPPGFVVKAGARQPVRVIYTPSGAGVSQGTARFTAQPCGIVSTFTVRGERTTVAAALDRANVDFGSYSACPTSVIRPDSTFLITNSGASPITVGVPRVDPPFFLMTDFPSSKVVQPGASLEIRIQYNPQGAFRDMGVVQEVRFPYSSLECTDTLRAQLQAATYRPFGTADPDTMDIGVVLGCEPTFDTLVTVTNPTNVPITVTGVAGNGFALPGGSVVVGPNTSRSVNVRVTAPAGTGAFALDGALTADPCAIIMPIRVEGMKIEPTYRPEAASVDFGATVVCGPQPRIDRRVVIVASGLSGLRSRVHAVAIGAPFSTDLTAGTTFTDSLIFTVSYTPSVIGSFADAVVVDLGPCSTQVTVACSAEAISSGRSTSITNSGFGTIAPGQTGSQTITITNTGTDTLLVEALEGVTLPFRVAASTPALPARLAPGAVADVTVEYTFAGYDRRDTITITSRTTGPCGDTVRFRVWGATVGRGVITGVVVSVPTLTTGVAGDVVTVPMSLSAPQPIDPANITTMTIYVSYDPAIIRAIDATPASPNVAATVAERAPGQARIELTSATPIVTANPLLQLRLGTYVGPTDRSPLRVDSAVAAGAEITGQNGTIQLTQDCAIEAGTGTIGQPVRLVVRSTSSEVVTATITTLIDAPSRVEMYDATGRRVGGSFDGVLGRGSHDITLEVSDLPCGSYLLVYRHGMFVRSGAVYLCR